MPNFFSSMQVHAPAINKPDRHLQTEKTDFTNTLKNHFAKDEDVLVTTTKPKRFVGGKILLWPSESKRGNIGVQLPGDGSYQVKNIEAAQKKITDFKQRQSEQSLPLREAFAKEVNVVVLDKKPTKPIKDRMAVWNSQQEKGTIKMHIPAEKKTYRFKTIDEIKEKIADTRTKNNHKLKEMAAATFGNRVDVLSSMPPVTKIPEKFSIQRSGLENMKMGFRVFIPGEGVHSAKNFQEVKTLFSNYERKSKLKEAVAEKFGDRVEVVSGRPHKNYHKLVVWENPKPEGGLSRHLHLRGHQKPLSVHVPMKGRFVVKNLEEAQKKIGNDLYAEPRLSSGSAVRVTGSDIPPNERLALEKQHGIKIHPVVVGEKELGYLFGGRNEKHRGTVVISAHGSGVEHKTFVKPEALELAYVASTDHILVADMCQFTNHYANDNIDFHRYESQIYDSNTVTATDYLLTKFTDINESTDDVSSIVGGMESWPAHTKKFDLFIVNGKASNVHLSDVIQGLKDTCGPDEQNRVVGSFCRSKSSEIGSGVTELRTVLKTPDPSITPFDYTSLYPPVNTAFTNTTNTPPVNTISSNTLTTATASTMATTSTSATSTSMTSAATQPSTSTTASTYTTSTATRPSIATTASTSTTSTATRPSIATTASTSTTSTATRPSIATTASTSTTSTATQPSTSTTASTSTTSTTASTFSTEPYRSSTSSTNTPPIDTKLSSTLSTYSLSTTRTSPTEKQRDG